jgi:hypothetical protein
MLLALLLGRLERRLEASTLPPAGERHARLRRHRVRPALAPEAVVRRPLLGRTGAGGRRRTAAPPSAVAVVPRAGRRQRLRARRRPGA